MQATIGRRSLMLAPLALAARPVRAADLPPIVFVHGNGDTAGLWLTTLWRFESNGIAPDRLFALDLRNSQASSVWDQPQPGRSTAAEVRDQLAAEVTRVKSLTGVDKVILVAQSRGGNTVRNYLKNGGGAAHVSAAVLCGCVNHGVIVSDKYLIGSEFNGASPFMRDLNSTQGEVLPGITFTTIRSTDNDKYAQPDGKYLGLPGTPTGVGFDGPALAGAHNIAIPAIDHRETGYGLAAFPALFQAVTAAAPATTAIVPEATPVLDGKVSGFDSGAPTNIAIAGARVTVWRTDAAGARQGDPVHDRTTGADGIWGPFKADPAATYEIVLAAPAYPITHIYRSPFPRSSSLVHLRPQPFAKGDEAADAVLYLSRPRGYFGAGRDQVELDGQPAPGIPPGVPTVSTCRLATTPGRSVTGRFNDETIPGYTWHRVENRVSVLEVTV